MKKFLKISYEVERALRYSKPVVALESTLIAQGLPYPLNVETAMKMEEAVKESGAIPATIAVIDGECIVGLTKEQVEEIGNGSRKVLKVGAGELPYALGKGLCAATTVSATAWIASLCKIRVFATGGIGGVHRGAENTFDISQDIKTMSQIPVIIVCAGAKSILDLPKTVEMLESSGVLCVGFQTDEFPAFYSRKSGITLNFRVDSPEETAKIFKAKLEIGTLSSILIGNPVPEEDEIPVKDIEKIIESAISDSKEEKVSGKELTPYLLNAISKKSEGKSLKTNISLLINNARLAGKIANAVSVEMKDFENGKIGFSL